MLIRRGGRAINPLRLAFGEHRCLIRDVHTAVGDPRRRGVTDETLNHRSWSRRTSPRYRRVGRCLHSGSPVTAQPATPYKSELAAKLDTLEDPRLSTDVRADIISGEGPAPRTALNPRGFGPEITVTNNVTGVTADGLDRLVATGTIKYDFPNGTVVETENPREVPFVRESDGQWRVDRAYLCATVAMMEEFGRQKGHDVKPDPGCV